MAFIEEIKRAADELLITQQVNLFIQNKSRRYSLGDHCLSELLRKSGLIDRKLRCFSTLVLGQINLTAGS